jgi:hypothetical protein
MSLFGVFWMEFKNLMRALNISENHGLPIGRHFYLSPQVPVKSALYLHCNFQNCSCWQYTRLHPMDTLRIIRFRATTPFLLGTYLMCSWIDQYTVCCNRSNLASASRKYSSVEFYSCECGLRPSGTFQEPLSNDRSKSFSQILLQKVSTWQIPNTPCEFRDSISCRTVGWTFAFVRYLLDPVTFQSYV